MRRSLCVRVNAENIASQGDVPRHFLIDPRDEATAVTAARGMQQVRSTDPVEVASTAIGRRVTAAQPR